MVTNVRKMKILGHIFTENTVLMDKEKINAVEEMKPPRNIKQLQQYLGLCNYYRRFIEKFSFIAAPLYGMLKKDMVWNWTKECQNAFDLLKTKLIEYPILRQPDLQKPFIIFTDASTKAIGAVLSQKERKQRICMRLCIPLTQRRRTTLWYYRERMSSGIVGR